MLYSDIHGSHGAADEEGAGMAKISATAAVDGSEYSATLDTVTLQVVVGDEGRRETVGRGVWSGTQIVDCGADIGEGAYGALEDAILDALARAEDVKRTEVDARILFALPRTSARVRGGDVVDVLAHHGDVVTVLVAADEDEDDCLAAAKEAVGDRVMHATVAWHDADREIVAVRGTLVR